MRRELTIDEKATNASTLEHIMQVNNQLCNVIKLLLERGIKHDASKLEDPELETFTIYTPKLKGTTYGSEAYTTFLKEMQVALDHHYSNNSHHPEYYEAGINGMDLLDLIEMICDWKAATMRHDDGDINKSLELNKNRFGIDDQLYEILKNTITRYF